MTAGIRCGVPFEQACGGNAECTTCHLLIPESIIEGEDYEEPS
jgi:ferredoxin